MTVRQGTKRARAVAAVEGVRLGVTKDELVVADAKEPVIAEVPATVVEEVTTGDDVSSVEIAVTTTEVFEEEDPEAVPAAVTAAITTGVTEETEDDGVSQDSEPVQEGPTD